MFSLCFGVPLTHGAAHSVYPSERRKYSERGTVIITTGALNTRKQPKSSLLKCSTGNMMAEWLTVNDIFTSLGSFLLLRDGLGGGQRCWFCGCWHEVQQWQARCCFISRTTHQPAFDSHSPAHQSELMDHRPVCVSELLGSAKKVNVNFQDTDGWVLLLISLTPHPFPLLLF